MVQLIWMVSLQTPGIMYANMEDRQRGEARGTDRRG